MLILRRFKKKISDTPILLVKNVPNVQYSQANNARFEPIKNRIYNLGCNTSTNFNRFHNEILNKNGRRQGFV